MAQDPRQHEGMKQWGQVVARAWTDDAYKQRLISDPQAVLAEAGVPVPPNVSLVVHESTPDQLHLVLPPRPAGLQERKLTEAELDQVAGGGAADSIESLFDWIGCAIGVYC